MLMLVTYDVNTEDKEGRRRLRRVARACLDFGQRVQNSVFDYEVDPAQWTALRARLLTEMTQERDSLRFYRLGAEGRARVEHFLAPNRRSIWMARLSFEWSGGANRKRAVFSRSVRTRKIY